MKVRVLLICLAITGVGGLVPRPAPSAVVVIANRAAAKVSFTISEPGGQSRGHVLDPGEVLPLPVLGVIGCRYTASDQRREYTLEPDSIYYFLNRDKKLALVRYGFEGEPPVDSHLPLAQTDAAAQAKLDEVGTITVKLLVDDDEPAVRSLWEKDLRERIAAASEIFEHYCRIRFQVIAVDTWNSDNAINDFTQSLREFECKVRPEPARLAIGFTRQYRPVRGRVHLGGIRGPLGSHILIRNWSQHLSQSERVEILAHELGHFLGAAHCGEVNSVMRPVVGSGRAKFRGFRVGIDPLNTLALNLVADQLRTRPALRFGQLSPETRTRLRHIYAAMLQELPGDTAATNLLLWAR